VPAPVKPPTSNPAPKAGTMSAAVNAPTPTPPSPPPTTAAPAQTLATSTSDMQGGVGSNVLAVVAPKSGAIDHPEGTPVVLVLKSFWTSKTMTWLRRTVYGAFGIGFVAAFGPAVAAGNLNGIDWNNVLSVFKNVFVFTIIVAVFGVMKKVDNDPVK
jgi:hypothetical protein